MGAEPSPAHLPTKPLPTSSSTRTPKTEEKEFLPSTPTMSICIFLGASSSFLWPAIGHCLALCRSRSWTMHVGRGLHRRKPHCPGTYLLFASWLQGMREGARYRVKWQGSQCPRLFQDAPGLMVKQPQCLPCPSSSGTLPALAQQSWEQGPAPWDTQPGNRSWRLSFQLPLRAAHGGED